MNCEYEMGGQYGNFGQLQTHSPGTDTKRRAPTPSKSHQARQLILAHPDQLLFWLLTSLSTGENQLLNERKL